MAQLAGKNLCNKNSIFFPLFFKEICLNTRTHTLIPQMHLLLTNKQYQPFNSLLQKPHILPNPQALQEEHHKSVISNIVTAKILCRIFKKAASTSTSTSMLLNIMSQVCSSVNKKARKILLLFPPIIVQLINQI